MNPLTSRPAARLLLALSLFLAHLCHLDSARAQSDRPLDLGQPLSPGRTSLKAIKLMDQGAKDPRLKGYLAPEGMKVEIVAEDPVVVNPIGMAFQLDGTPLIIEWRSSPDDPPREVSQTLVYKDGTKRPLVAVKKKVRDVVKRLEDTKGKGVFDQAKVILEEEFPSSILLHNEWIYLSGRGRVRRFKQKEPGGAYTIKEVVAQGFGGLHHHQVSGLTIGNDGWLYITTGEGDNHVEGSDGSRATVLRTGAIFRCRPDGSRLHTFAVGFCNPYGDAAFDAEGNLFHADNDAAASGPFSGCRLLHVPEETDFGWRLRPGSRGGQPDLLRANVAGEAPGKMPPMRNTGRGAPSGLLSYDDARLPETYRGLICYPDVVRQEVRGYRVEPRGATFAVAEEFVLLRSDDPLFRPCKMLVGPDGAIYLVDWRTDVSGGRFTGDGKHGRIYRISWAGTKEQPPITLRPRERWAVIARSSDAELVKTLSSEEATERTIAQSELVRRGEKNRPALLKLLQNGELPLPARIAALGALLSMWNDEVQKTVQEVLGEGEAPLRRLAAEGLALRVARSDKTTQDCLLRVLNDDDPAVRRAVALAMGRIAGPGAADALVNTLAFDDSQDIYLHDGIVRAIERLGKPGIDALLALAESGIRKETNRVVDTFATLRTRAGYTGLPNLLKYPHLTIEQRVKLIRSCANYQLDPPIFLDPIIVYLSSPAGAPPEVKRVGAELLAAGGTQPGDKAAAWLLGLLTDEDAGVRLAGMHAVEAMRLQPGRPMLNKLAADPTRSADEREAARNALRALDKATTPAKER